MDPTASACCSPSARRRRPPPAWAASRFYAMDGDLVGVSSGRLLRFGPPENLTGRQWHLGAAPCACWPDATSSAAAAPGPLESSPSRSATATPTTCSSTTRRATSRWCARRDIIAGSFTVAGPGTLEISAGRNIQMLDQAAVLSMGPVVPGDTRGRRHRHAGRPGRAGRRLRRLPAPLPGPVPRRRSVAAADRPGPAVQDLRTRTAAVADAGLRLRRQYQRRARLLRRAAARAAARVRAPGLLRRAARRRPRVQRQVQPAPGQLPARPPGHRRAVPGARGRRRLCRRHHHVWRRGSADARRRRSRC